MSVLPISQTHEDFSRAVSLMPTGNLRFLFSPSLDSNDLVLSDRTLYLPIDSNNAVLAMTANQIGFFKIFDRVMSSPIDSILMWVSNTFEYSPYWFFHPLFVSRHNIHPDTATEQLGCSVPQLLDYFYWFTKHKSEFSPSYISDVSDSTILTYTELLEDYLSSKSYFTSD